MSPFGFLNDEWPELCDSASKVAALTLSDPRAACFYARRTLEQAVEWLYAHDSSLVAPYDTTLAARLHEPTFRRAVPQDLFLKARLVKDLGNDAVHSNRAIEERDSKQAAKELFHILYWLARTYTLKGADHYAGLMFDVNALAPSREQVITPAQIRALAEKFAGKDKKLKEQEEALVQSQQTADAMDAEIARLRAEIAEAKKRNEAVPDDHDYSEAETRDFFIDLLLREAGWMFSNAEDREYPVEGMPNNRGKGYVDYVLWGDDGLPLAVVEAKRTKKDPRIGQQQAKLYADCLEKKFGQRPVLFYTNGYETWLWDDVNYPPRPVQGFYKKDELALLIQRRTSKKSLPATSIDVDIVERPYQTLAIRSIAQALEQQRRKALIVMATGAGKTRTVVALTDLLQRANWVKRVLFLADRVALVRQAANAYKAFLPSSSPLNLVTEKENTDSRVCICTYPTMMGLIDEMKADGTRRFGAGHFDLVVIDEAHRSVYQKYGAIFDYFDSLLVGLTATPKDDVDRNTYRLFELENGVPTFAYELDEAVSEGWLVPPLPVSVPLKFQRQGINYDELSEEEKEEWDALEWDEEGNVPDKVEANAVNKWLFNADTVDKVLEHLMTRGLKVEDGDRLGKTIIFAKNHAHAMFIQERFDKNYPHLKGSFARVIDNYETYAQTLIDDFSTPSKSPHIAISVDMLDTGVDIPEVVNLVFFKLVRSKTKFFQMLGRGTRLRPDLFGPGRDKQYFYLFDYCQNLEYFNQDGMGTEGNVQESLGKKLFLRRLELLEDVNQMGDEETARLSAELADRLHSEVAAMNTDNFVVRPQRKYVERYQEREAWEELKPEEYVEIGEHLSDLPSELDPEEINAKQFDLLLLNLQLALLNHEPSFSRLRERVIEIAALLEEKQAIPLVNAQMELILALQTEEFWTDVTLMELERVRKRIRDLVKFIDKTHRKIIYTDFEDTLGDESEVDLTNFTTTVDVVKYKTKVMHFLEEHKDHPVLQKLRHNQPVTVQELGELEAVLLALGGEEGKNLFVKSFGEQPSLGAFIRKLVGLDREAVRSAFGRYLETTQYNANQIRFVNLIIGYLTKNGTMDPALLYEQPFINLNPLGIEGLFQNSEADGIIGVLSTINANAGLSKAA
jgi:type I restriction enzyme R subunit